jgi:DNA repair and recombination protein RAD52
MDWEKATAELTRKLDPAHVKGRTQGGTQVQYVEGWHAIAEANRIFGFGNWDRETMELRLLGEPRNVGDKWRVEYLARVRIGVTLPGKPPVIRDGCGFGQGIDKDVGQAHESALKEAETDAMKRALMTFGNPFGLALYDKSRENVGVDEPRATDAEVTAAMDAANACADIAALKAWWTGLTRGAPHVAAEADVIAAKDARKAQLTERKEAA